MKEKLLSALNWRYATKKYNPTFVLEEEDKQTLESVLQLTPTSYGLQPLHFIWINNVELRAQIQSIAWNQQQITDASEVLILCAKNALEPAFLDQHADHMRDTRGLKEEQIQGFRKHLHSAIGQKAIADIKNWNGKQAYIALGQLLTACALLELDATPMEGFDPTALDDLLQLGEEGLHSVLICTIGKRDSTDTYQSLQKVRRSKKSLFSTR